MRKLKMKYRGPANRDVFELIAMGIELAEYMQEKTEKTAVAPGHGIFGKGPYSRSISITYDIYATPKNNVHRIEITDALLNEEEWIGEELVKIYKKYKFSPLGIDI